MRHYGLQVFDNPYETDESRSMGIMLSDTFQLPFRSHGLTIYFRSWYPTDEELNTYGHVILTSDQAWDPHGLVMPGGDLEDSTFDDERFVQQLNSAIASGCNGHHKRYNTDMALYSIDGLTEQALYE